MGLIRGVLTQIGWTTLCNYQYRTIAEKKKRKILPRAHFLGLIPQANFLRQTLVEGERTGLAAAVVGHLAEANEAGGARDGDDVAVVTLDHGGQELFDSPPVGQGVDFKHLANGALGFVEDGALVANASVIDEHSRVAMLLAHLCANCLDAVCRGHVALVKVGIGC